MPFKGAKQTYFEGLAPQRPRARQLTAILLEFESLTGKAQAVTH
jgi:hypothetical protein